MGCEGCPGNTKGGMTVEGGRRCERAVSGLRERCQQAAGLKVQKVTYITEWMGRHGGLFLIRSEKVL